MSSALEKTNRRPLWVDAATSFAKRNTTNATTAIMLSNKPMLTADIIDVDVMEVMEETADVMAAAADDVTEVTDEVADETAAAVTVEIIAFYTFIIDLFIT